MHMAHGAPTSRPKENRKQEMVIHLFLSLLESSNSTNSMHSKRRHYHSYSRLYGWFLSLASVMVLTGLQLRAQLLLTRQITEQSPVAKHNVVVVASSLYDLQPRKRHLLLETPETFRASSFFDVVDDDSSQVQFVRVHMHSISYAASCLQSLLSATTMTKQEEEGDYDMISILLDETTTITNNDDEDLNFSLLTQRLRQRYPSAQLFIHRINTKGTTAQEEYHLLSTASYDPAKDTMQQKQPGSWGMGDACYWFQEETRQNEAPLWLEFNPRAIQRVSSQQSSYWLPSFFLRRLENAKDDPSLHEPLSHEYYYYNDAKQTLAIHNPFDTERMLYLTYKIGPEEALTRIRLNGILTVVIEPYRELDMNDSVSWETSPVGKIGPRQVMRVQWESLSSPMADDDGMFRLLGVDFGVQP